jgi:hypothetical protein
MSGDPCEALTWTTATQTTGPDLTLDNLLAALEELKGTPAASPPLEIYASEHVPRGERVWLSERRVVVNREDRDELALEALLAVVFKRCTTPIDDLET